MTHSTRKRRKNKKVKLHVSWEDAGIMIDQLCEHIKRSTLQHNIKYDGIYAVPRGGLILGVALSHTLNIPLLVHPTSNTLVCDDISDTGITLSNLKHKHIATLYKSNWTTVTPDYTLAVKDNKQSWIVFPWENQNTEVKLE